MTSPITVGKTPQNSAKSLAKSEEQLSLGPKDLTPDTKYATLNGAVLMDNGDKSEDLDKSNITEVAIDSSSESQNSQKQIISLVDSSSVSVNPEGSTNTEVEVPLQKKKVGFKNL